MLLDTINQARWNRFRHPSLARNAAISRARACPFYRRRLAILTVLSARRVGSIALLLRIPRLQPVKTTLSLPRRDLISMIPLDGIDNILRPNFGSHVEEFRYLAHEEPHMRSFRSSRGLGRGCRIPPTAVIVLEAADIRCISVCAADDAEKAVVGRPTAYHHALLVAPRHSQLPVLPHRYTPYQRLEVLQRRKLLAHMEARVHLGHRGQGIRRKANGGESMPTELPSVEFHLRSLVPKADRPMAHRSRVQDTGSK